MFAKEDSFIEELYRLEYNKLLGYAQRRLNNMELSQDLVQDVFHEAVRHKERLYVHPNPQGWLVQTLKNKILANERERTQYTKLFVSSEEIKELAAPNDSAYEVLEAIRRVLSEDELSLFKRIVLHGESYLEISNELGITVWACQKRVSRIKEKLRDVFPDHQKNKKTFKVLCQLLVLTAIYR